MSDTKTRQFYQEGIGENAGFRIIESFLQLNRTTVLVVDQLTNCLRLVNRLTNETSRILGNCTALSLHVYDGNDPQFNTPQKIIRDSVTSDQLILTEAGSRRLRTINTTSWRVGTRALFMNHTLIPVGIVQQENGNLYLTQRNTGGGVSVMDYDYVSKRLTVLAGSSVQAGFNDGPLLETRFQAAGEVIMLGFKRILVTDQANHRLCFLNLGWNFTFSICTGEQGKKDGVLSDCTLKSPRALLAINDTIYIGAHRGIHIIKGELVFKTSNCAESSTIHRKYHAPSSASTMTSGNFETNCSGNTR